MIELTRPRATRRAPAPPPALRAELVRPRLLAELSRRFDVQVTQVVAGAGFGKTTLLAQAIRANEAEPRGIDAWVSCEPGDEDARRFALALTAALGGSPSRRDPTERVLDALGDLSPLDVCLVLDDLHELLPESTSVHFLEELVRRLPPHAHLLLASREPLTLSLARLRAGGQVVELGVEHLAFTPVEAETLAEIHGQADTQVEDFAGWPSLVRLALSAPPDAPRQFLWEEIIDGLSPDEQRGLLALATLGWGSAADVQHVAGTAVDVDRLVTRVPLLRRDDDGWFVVHQLWEDAVERLYPAADVAELRRRALHLLQGRSETVRAGGLAIRWGDSETIRIAARALVRESFGSLPVDTASRWLAEAPDEVRELPELALLALAVRQAASLDDPDLDDDLDALAARFESEGDHDGLTVTLALGTVAAHFRGDDARLIALAGRVNALPDAHREPILKFLTGAVAAALAALLGDVDGALQAIESLSFSEVPESVTELVTRLHVAMLASGGRADEAVVIGKSLERSQSKYVRNLPPLLQWLAGDPTGYATSRFPIDAAADVNERDRFLHAAFGTAVSASFGDRKAIATLRPLIERMAAGEPDARDSALSAAAIACRQLVEHDEQGAADTLAGHLVRYPVDDPLGDIHLRRCFAIVYGCNAAVRARWDVASLGPAHERSRVVARELLDARAGRLTRRSTLAPTSIVFTSVPLPWSAELAARAEAVGCRDGRRLATELTAHAPVELHDELVWLSTNGDEEARRGAGALLDLVPDPARAPLRIELLGPLRLTIGGAVVDAAELRRGRIRALLMLLALAGPLRREQIMDLMWPDLDPLDSARNLRVTLSGLRHLLEPDRAPGDPCLSLPIEAESLSLATPPLVDVDLWQLRRHLADAERAERDGNPAQVVAFLEQACELWRGDPLPDLQPFVTLAAEIEQVKRLLVDAAIRLGELEFLAGRFDDALGHVTRAVRASPYSERAHRLIIAAHLQRRDREGLERAVLEVEDLLRDLGAEPEGATKMLIRQARTRLDAGRSPPDSSVEAAGQAHG